VSANIIYFEDIKVGDQNPSISMLVEKAEVIEFASKWDPQPWHIDEALAKQSMFGGLTACSAHIFSLFCVISQQWASGVQQQVLASLGFDEMRMLKPVYAGDTLYCLSTVEVARPSNSKPDRGIVACRCELINQHGDVVFSILSTYLVAKKT
jgi:acyl dehydratase